MGHMSKTESDRGASAALPLEADAILKLAARSMFDLFASMSQGMMLVDRSGRVVWINDGYKQFLPALGFERAELLDRAFERAALAHHRLRRVLIVPEIGGFALGSQLDQAFVGGLGVKGASSAARSTA